MIWIPSGNFEGTWSDHWIKMRYELYDIREEEEE